MADEWKQTVRGAGGTPGGLGEFGIGLLMVVIGGYLLLNQVTVSTGFWALWGYQSFGLTLVPLLVGIGWLFFDARSVLGWLLLIVGAVIIFASIIVNLNIYFRPTSLFNTLMMLGLLLGGLGLIAKSFRSH